MFEMDSIPENAKCCNYNNKFIFLMPEYSRHEKIKKHRHVITNNNKISKNIHQTLPTGKIPITRVKTCSARFSIYW